MSLKAFHIVFVVASTTLLLLFGVWGVRDYAHTGNVVNLAMGSGSFLGSLLLAGYGVWFLKKLKHVSYL